jgi:hypothetical protein
VTPIETKKHLESDGTRYCKVASCQNKCYTVNRDGVVIGRCKRYRLALVGAMGMQEYCRDDREA